MRIRSLEISGFKSFGERAVLQFGQGISAIVGPNGCGKSNVVDAIRWVMGEQNPRHLRGRLMEDIIFSGTEIKQPVGMAEVVMLLDNTDRRGPTGFADFNEIQIARRLYRSGESEYLINKIPVRMRDVMDFFLDTGVGTRGYTIVEQGQIAGIVSNKPEERRVIFEEAAGIGKYRARRRETENKLKNTEQNLLRVTDILGELKRQIGSLDRQAQKATRYKKLSASIRDLELVVSREELSAEDTKVRDAKSQFEVARTRSVALDAQVSRAEAAVAEERKAHVDRERELQSSNDRLFALRSEIQALQSRIEYERREREGLQRLMDERDVEIKSLEEQADAHTSSLNSLVEELSCLTERLQTEEVSLREREQALQQQTEALASLQGRREAAQARIMSCSTEVGTLESRIESFDERHQELEQSARKNDERLEARSLEVESFQREEIGLGDRLRQSMSDQDELGRRLADVIRAHQDAVEMQQNLQVQLASTRETVQQIVARYDLLEEAEREESERVAETLERLPDAQRRVLKGRVADVLRIEDGLEAALEAVLGPVVDAVIASDADGALQLLDWFKRSVSARATVLPLDGGDVRPRSGFVPLGEPLLRYVHSKPPFEGVAARLLSDVYLVDSLDEAVKRFSSSDTNAVFVTREGELLDRMGVLTGGAGAPAGAVARAAELRRLGGERTTLLAEVDRLEQMVATQIGRAKELDRETENTRNRRHTAELAVVNVEKDLERVRERGKEAAEFLEEHRSGKEKISGQLQVLQQDRGQAAERLQALITERSTAETERDQLATEIGSLSRDVERLEKQVVQDRIRLAEQGARRDQLVESRNRVQTSLTDANDWLTRRREEVRTARERCEELETSATEAMSALTAKTRDEDQFREAQEALREAYNSSGQRLETTESESRTAIQEREALREDLARTEMALHEAQMRREQLIERIDERYGLNLAEYEPPAEALEGDPKERARELEKLRSSLRSLGEVNLGALEEYEEVSERFRYLGEQKADLELSIERLRNAIGRINRTSRTRFRETFEAVNEEFKRLFPKMFKGGKAHLSLTEAEDVLDSGIEITAQPPGKKLQNVNLLSGGEKSLTALALLTAVFTVKPSPFFLLDEVDAALDDANVGRFNEMLKEMSKTSQFLVITHNKGTIEISDTLYGVTMQRPGVSTLVTVDLKQ